MKKRNEWYEGRKVGQKFGFVFLIIWVVVMFFGVKANSASFNHIINVPTYSNWDSCIIIIEVDGNIRDSSVITSDSTYVFNTDSVYFYTKVDFWDGIAEGVPDPAVPVIAISAELIKDTLLDGNPMPWTTGSVSGTGSDTINYFAIDTSGTDIGVERANITVLNASGAFVTGGLTDGTGKKTLFIDPGTYTVIATNLGYFFNSLAYVVSGNDDSAQISGYNLTITVPTPDDSNLCNVYGTVLDRGNGVYGATVTLTIPNHAYDSCDNSIIVKKVFKDYTDVDGLFSLYVPKSSCLNRNKNGSLMKYTVDIEYKNEDTKTFEFSIPADSSTYMLVF